MEWNKTFLSIYPLPTLLTPLPLIPFTTEEITGCSNEAVKYANKAGRNLPSCFFISCFTVSVMPSINTFESSNDFVILIILFISSFEINRINLFPAQTAPFPLLFFSSFFIAFKAELFNNPSKISVAKGIQTFVSLLVLFCLNYLTK